MAELNSESHPSTAERNRQTLRQALHVVERHTGLTDAAEALTALRTVAEGLVERLTPADATDLISELPSALHASLLEAPKGPNERLTLDSLCETLAERLGVGPTRAAALLRAVTQALRDLVSPQEFHEVMVQLPGELDELMKEPEPLTLALFDSVQRSATAVDALLAAGVPSGEIGLLMTERSAELARGRAQAPAPAGDGAFQGEARTIAAGLRPLGPLGAAGSGWVATRPLGARLLGVGQSNSVSLEQALAELGLGGQAGALCKQVDDGAVLLSLAAADGRALQALTANAARSWHLPITAEPSPSRTAPPPAPASSASGGIVSG